MFNRLQKYLLQHDGNRKFFEARPVGVHELKYFWRIHGKSFLKNILKSAKSHFCRTFRRKFCLVGILVKIRGIVRLVYIMFEFVRKDQNCKFYSKQIFKKISYSTFVARCPYGCFPTNYIDTTDHYGHVASSPAQGVLPFAKCCCSNTILKN